MKTGWFGQNTWNVARRISCGWGCGMRDVAFISHDDAKPITGISVTRIPPWKMVGFQEMHLGANGNTMGSSMSLSPSKQKHPGESPSQGVRNDGNTMEHVSKFIRFPMVCSPGVHQMQGGPADAWTRSNWGPHVFQGVFVVGYEPWQLPSGNDCYIAIENCT